MQRTALTLSTTVSQRVFLAVVERCNEISSRHWQLIPSYSPVPTSSEPSTMKPWRLSNALSTDLLKHVQSFCQIAQKPIKCYELFDFRAFMMLSLKNESYKCYGFVYTVRMRYILRATRISASDSLIPEWAPSLKHGKIYDFWQHELKRSERIQRFERRHFVAKLVGFWNLFEANMRFYINL